MDRKIKMSMTEGKYQKKTVRLADIASRAGISVVAVSKALNGQKGVSESTRRRVLALAREIGYEKSENSGGFAIGILIAARYMDIAIERTETFYFKMYRQAVALIQRQENHAMLELITDEMAEKGIMPGLTQEGRVDAILVIGKPPFGYENVLRTQWKKPLLFLDFYDEDGEIDAVISNSVYGTYLLTKYLLSCGHRDIGFFGTLLSTDSITDRYLGYRKAMLEYQLPVKEEWIIPDRDPNTGGTVPIQLPNKMPTAFVCNCDIMAMRLMERLEEKGYQVPQDISIVGFDNFIHDREENSRLTTYAVDTRQMAERGVSILLNRLNGQTEQQGLQIINGTILKRDSVRTLNP